MTGRGNGGFWVNWWALGFIAVGVWWLLGDLGITTFNWGLAGPIAIIVVGLSMLFGGWRRRMWWSHYANRGWHKDDCACSCSCCTEARGSTA
ncbi:MAG: LiaF transmembrane domain-containing protein [Thermoplasmatota archaeon]